MNNTILQDSYYSFVNSKNMLVILVYVFVIVTFFTTFNGVISYIFGSIDNTPLVSLIIFGVVLFCLQAYLLLRSTYHVIEFRKNSLVKNVIWLLIWLFTFTFSATFSYTFYYDRLSAEAHGQRVIAQQIDVVVSNAEKYLQSFDAAKAQMNDLAKYSNDTASIEGSKGGTCGDKSPPGPGPRIRYRLEDKIVFQEQANKVSQLHSQVVKEIEQFKLQQKRFLNKKIKTIPELQAAFNASVRRLNSFNEQHPVLLEVSRNLAVRTNGNRKTDGQNKDGSSIFCFDKHIDNTVAAIQRQFKRFKAIPKVTLFDRNNRRELQNRVVEVFLSPFQKTSENNENEFSKYDYIALGLGFLIETLMFVITLILHSTEKGYPTNRFGYIGERFSSKDALRLKEYLNVDKQDLMRVSFKAKKHQLGYFIVNETKDDYCPILSALDRQGLFNKKINAVRFKTLPKKVRELEQLDDEDMVNVYYSPNTAWTDYSLSVTHMKERK